MRDGGGAGQVPGTTNAQDKQGHPGHNAEPEPRPSLHPFAHIGRGSEEIMLSVYPRSEHKLINVYDKNAMFGVAASGKSTQQVPITA